ncbi:MAG: DUF3667 domain-containing protein [Pseudomonadota bacterium]
MSTEAEMAGLASAGALESKGETRDPSPHCRNCGGPIGDKYCTRCGQLNETYHRPLLTLVVEAVSDAFSLDGRLARTLPALVFRPGRATRAYLDGHRARYVPPFRLYVLSSLVFFAILFWVIDRNTPDEFRFDPATAEVAAAEVSVGQATSSAGDLLNPDGTVNREAVYALVFGDEAELDLRDQDSASRLVDQIINAYENQTLLQMILESWAPRLALLLFPVFALFLTLAYAWVRRFYIYDHVITALHFQTFMYLMSASQLALGGLIGGWAAMVFALTPPIYLYRLLRVTYDTGRILAVLRTFVLIIASFMALVALVAALLVIGVAQV